MNILKQTKNIPPLKVPKLLCWMRAESGHGLILSCAIWLPEEDRPESTIGAKYVRVPKFDLKSTSLERIRIGQP